MGERLRFHCWTNGPKIHCMPPRIPPPLVMLIAAALMWTLHHWLPLGHLIDFPWNYLGVLPAAIGRVITVAAGNRFRQARTTFDAFRPGDASSLVTDGVFRVSRNPMYFGFALLTLGLAILVDSAWMLLALPISLVLIDRFAITREERYLERKFGEEYLNYKRSVRRWI